MQHIDDTSDSVGSRDMTTIPKHDEPKAGVELGTATIQIDDTALGDYYEGLELNRPR